MSTNRRIFKHQKLVKIMEALGYLHLASVYEESESIEVVPLGVNFKFWQRKKLSSAAAMRLLSVALTMSLLSLAGQALAIEKIGNNGPGVTYIQRCLSKLGYFRGPVTGKFGSLTQQAVISFQQANRLTADGVVGTGSQRILQQACQIRTQSNNIRQNSTANVSGELRLGSRGPAVSQLQQRLQKSGHFNGPITGYYGPKTQEAVIRSQQSSRTRMNTRIAPASTTQAFFNNPSEGGEYPVIFEGSNGPTVTRLQQRLQQLGYFNANPTGNFGTITRDAVMAFQRNYGIPANGIANQQTWNALMGSQSQALSRPSLSAQEVTELQERLRDLGYLRANPTGNFGAMTRDALIQFQRDYRLSADGIADTQILQAVRQVWQDRYAKQPARNYLTIGDSGQNVRAVQERLLQLGFFNANPNGNFDENTRAYVYSFQQYSRLNPTGIVDAQTWQALGLNTSPVDNRGDKNRYVVIVPVRNADTLNRVRQYMPNAVVDKSGLGDYVNAGAFGDRIAAEQHSKILRSYGLDARVQFF
jgi:peptidoglycan hydrolase-like protein with peptidoglycan-binding domain